MLTIYIGPPASGKSTHARQQTDAWVLNLDAYRAAICGDETDQDATAAAVARLHGDLDVALAADCDVTVDATNAAFDPDRRELLAIAALNDTTATAVVMDTPLSVCLARNATRPGPQPGRRWGRRVPAVIVTQMHAAIASTTTDDQLRREGFAHVKRVPHCHNQTGT